ELDVEIERREGMAEADAQAHRPVSRLRYPPAHCEASNPAIASATEMGDSFAAVVSPFGLCNAVKIASGSVWVRPGILPAKVITAPKLPSDEANPIMPATNTPGAASGSVMVANRSNGPAPSVRAACSNPGSIASNDRRTARSMSGNEVTAQASAAPAGVNTSLMSNQSESQLPIGPRTPNKISSSQPTT